MITYIPTLVRPARPEDRLQLSTLLQFEPYVHRHLDWKAPLDWIGSSPYLVVEKQGRVVAALACPPDPPDVAWVRIFALANGLSLDEAWYRLWSEARAMLASSVTVAAIAMESWFQKVLLRNGFRHTHNVVMLSWERSNAVLEPPRFAGQIRPMQVEDLPAIQAVDEAAFSPLWRNSNTSLQLAFRQNNLATVATNDNGILGYQISTPSPLGSHLARLAVHPHAQGEGIGYALVYHLVKTFKERGALQITVNTQRQNYASLALYKKAQFKPTQEEYPVYQYEG